MKKIIKSEALWVILMVGVLYALAYGPVVYRYQHPISGRTYLGFNAFAIDPLGYIATAQQGYAGRWTRLPQATSALGGKAFFVRSEYILTGHLARILSIHPLIMLKITTAVISVVYIMIIWKIIEAAFISRRQRLTGFFLVCFATGIILPSQTNGGWLALPIDTLVFQRLTLQQPHYMLSGLLTLVSVFMLSETLKQFRLKTFLVAVISGTLANHMFFPPMLLVYLSFGVYIVFEILRRTSLVTLRNYVIIITGFTLITALPLSNLWYSSQFYDMNTFRVSERMIPNAFVDFAGYQLSLGWLWVLTLISIPRFLAKKNVFQVLSLSYVLVHPLATFIVGARIGMSQVRFFQTPYFIFLAITGAAGIDSMFDLIRNRVKRSIATITAVLFITVTVISSISVYKKSLAYTVIGQYDMSEFGYPVTGNYKAMMWLGQFCNYQKSVLSDAINGNLILALTPCRVYMSDWVWKTQIAEGGVLEDTKNRFFAGEMGESEALEFVRGNGIKFIYFGLPEQQHHHSGRPFSHLGYSFLIPIYERDGVVIYKTD
ncbi:hypothetical protein A2154_00080 [Candidatus Gottesmanbacteria bacterium RBG_16_43_7]|uniref:Glycosyltransferase RgtA/B/C/D-like domain-containing protein n=1 Tax=Candidatus Gottesmanbacteria bacterium RBG_16_43_7 TaxID=1798373 RepID=A0A1F5Z9P0_9BACT|nr:MAG: hypothetical protein A2154_00080 [Candidatus Gottesmanbacteria bacterium RBG_16_43_7]